MHQIFLIVLVITTVADSQSTCKQNSPIAVCSHPKPFIPDADFKWSHDHQPADGWHMVLSNSAVRLHFAELMQGKLLNYTDDFSNMCARFRFDHTQDLVDGKFYGFGSKKANFQCYPSKAEPAAIYCDFSSAGLGKYDDHSLSYTTFADHENLLIIINCFPNGENGWVAYSKTASLNEGERKSVLDHIRSLGYDDSDVVSSYDESCADHSVDASYLVSQRVRPIRRRFRNVPRSRYYHQYQN